jgi:molybdopterin synthase sulfur carrier subunit
MAVTVHIPGPLRDLAGGRSLVALDGSPGTVKKALAALTAAHPGLRDRLMDERGRLRPHVNVFVGREDIRWTGGLETTLPAGAELHILPAVSGG